MLPSKKKYDKLRLLITMLYQPIGQILFGTGSFRNIL